MIYDAKMKPARVKREWAKEEFGEARLGDQRRTQRLVQMAAQAAQTPAGQITQVFTDSAAREAAYRLLESDSVEARQLVRAAAQACLARASGSYVVVPVDQSSLSLPSADGDKAFGPVGNGVTSARGMEAMSAIALTPEGTPLGVAAQTMWVRRPSNGKPHRPFEEKEIRYWLEVMDAAVASFSGPVRPWFQLDRGADFKEALRWAAASNAYVTVRACHDRRAESQTEGLLWDVVEGSAVVGHYELGVPARPGRKARIATMQVRSSPVYLPLRDSWSHSTGPVILYAVHTKEVSPVPRGQEPVEWMLLVNRAVTTLEEACEVIRNYALRWRIEEIHKTWKSTCRVESSNLRSPDTFATWATLLFCIAVRIERLKRLARTDGRQPASLELSHWEIRTLLLHKDRAGYEANRMPSIEEAVRWLAELGGYTGKNSGGPPGSMTLGRGLLSLGLAAETLRIATEAKL